MLRYPLDLIYILQKINVSILPFTALDLTFIKLLKILVMKEGLYPSSKKFLKLFFGGRVGGKSISLWSQPNEELKKTI